MRTRPFIKMHGLGNDFVVLDARQAPFELDAAAARAIADRRRGVGCDQIVIVEPAANGAADVALRFRNNDGTVAAACGNGTRCAAALVMERTGATRLSIQTEAGVLGARAAAGGAVAIDMGPARTHWRDIPLARETDTLHLDLTHGPLADPVATGMGNPHATFFVADAAAIDLAALGPTIEHDPLFPERANIGVAQVSGPGALRLRMWERGAGITLACGTGACAAAVAAARRGLTGRQVAVTLDGGDLQIDWRADGHVVMTGPVATAFAGEIDLDALIGDPPP